MSQLSDSQFLSDADWAEGIIILPTDEPWFAQAENNSFRRAVEEGREDCFAGSRAIQRGSEMGYVPRKAFLRYIFDWITYLESDASMDDADSPSVFISLLATREVRDPGCVSMHGSLFIPCLDLISKSQQHFDADEDIYGSLSARILELKKLVLADFRP